MNAHTEIKAGNSAVQPAKDTAEASGAANQAVLDIAIAMDNPLDVLINCMDSILTLCEEDEDGNRHGSLDEIDHLVKGAYRSMSRLGELRRSILDAANHSSP